MDNKNTVTLKGGKLAASPLFGLRIKMARFEWEKTHDLDALRTHTTKHFIHPTEPRNRICIQSSGLLHAKVGNRFVDLKEFDHKFREGKEVQEADVKDGKVYIMDLPDLGGRVELKDNIVRVFDEDDVSVFKYTTPAICERDKEAFVTSLDADGLEIKTPSQYLEYVEFYVDGNKLYLKMPSTLKAKYPIKVYDDVDTDSVNSKDARLFSGNPTYNYGVINWLYVGLNAAGAIGRMPIHFTLSSGSGTISLVELILYGDVDSGSSDLNIHQLTQTGWVEGTGDGSATGDGATWNTYDGSNNWTSAGGDFNATIIDTVTVLVDDYITFVLMGAGATNPLTLDWEDDVHLLIKRNGESGTNQQNHIASKEHATSALRPVIQITYTPAITYKSLSGSLGLSGSLNRKTLKSLSGTLTSIGSLGTQLVGNFFQSVGGTLNMAGSLGRNTKIALAGTLTSSGALTSTLRFLQSLSGTLSFSGSLGLKTLKSLSGILSSSSSLGMKTVKGLAGSLTSSGSVNLKTFISVTGTLTSSGTLSSILTKFISLGGTLNMSGSLSSVLTIFKSLSGTLNMSGSVSTIKRYVQALYGYLRFDVDEPDDRTLAVAGAKTHLAGNQVQYYGGATNHTVLNDDNGDVSYAYGSEAYSFYCSRTVWPFETFIESDSINSVTIYYKVRREGVRTGWINSIAYVNSTAYYGDTLNFSTSYVLRSQTLTTNPNTGLPWTISTINNSKFGYQGTSDNIRVTYMYIVVDFNLPSGHGTLQRKTKILLPSSLGLSGSLGRKTKVSFGGLLESAGSLVRLPKIALGGSLTSAGSIGLKTMKQLAGNLTTSGTLSSVLRKLISLSGTLGLSGEVNLKVVKLLSGALTSSGSLGLKVMKSFSGTLNSSGALTIKMFVNLSGTLGLSGTLSSVLTIFKSLSGTLTTSGSLGIKVFKSLSGSVTSSGSIIIKSIVSLSGALGLSGALSLKTKIALYGAIGLSGSLGLKIKVAVGGALSFIGSLVKKYWSQAEIDVTLSTEGAADTILSTASNTTAELTTENNLSLILSSEEPMPALCSTDNNLDVVLTHEGGG